MSPDAQLIISTHKASPASQRQELIFQFYAFYNKQTKYMFLASFDPRTFGVPYNQ
jgi:hypothetical protein